MNVQVLVSTMHQSLNDYSLLDRMNIQSDAVVVNQCDRNHALTIKHHGYAILWINTTERGLSNSRNMAIQHASADYCLLADDDEVFVQNYAEIIKQAFDDNKNASLIRFQIEGIEDRFKSYPLQTHRIGYIQSLKISSVEMSFRRSHIIDKQLLFDPLLGTGAEFNHGEENAFIFDCLRNGLNIIYIPSVISRLHIGNSTWFKGYNKDYFLGSGASYTAMSEKFAWFFILQFALRKYTLYKKEMTLLSAIRYMFEGKKEYLRKKQSRGVK